MDSDLISDSEDGGHAGEEDDEDEGWGQGSGETHDSDDGDEDMEGQDSDEDGKAAKKRKSKDKKVSSPPLVASATIGPSASFLHPFAASYPISAICVSAQSARTTAASRLTIVQVPSSKKSPKATAKVTSSRKTALPKISAALKATKPSLAGKGSKGKLEIEVKPKSIALGSKGKVAVVKKRKVVESEDEGEGEKQADNVAEEKEVQGKDVSLAHRVLYRITINHLTKCCWETVAVACNARIKLVASHADPHP